VVDAVKLEARAAESRLSGLVDLLLDVVVYGALVSFLPSLTRRDATLYWQDVISDVSRGHKLLWTVEDGGRVLGCVQLEFARNPNARHRAEVLKLLVHSTARRRGIATELMDRLEQESVATGRSLLVLDTRAGDAASHLYESRGYTRVGVIPGHASLRPGEFDDVVFFYKNLSTRFR
jgi:acetyltransferase